MLRHLWRVAGWLALSSPIALFLLPAPAAQAPDVRLAVLVVFDQLRGDYPRRWAEVFGEDGFRRLGREGASFENCHYPYSNTVTGAGHASLATGTWPARHGVIGNNWYERSEGEAVYCATLPRYQRVPPVEAKAAGEGPEGGGKSKKARAGGAPDRLLTQTLADVVKQAGGKVVSLSLKDRGAVFMGGRRPDACYWFDTADGRFVTSTYYRDCVHPWVEEFDRGRPADFWFGRAWRRLRPDLDYQKYSGPDDVAGEGVGFKKSQGRTFPHPMTGGAKQPGTDYYETLTFSPFGNDLLLELARKAIDTEKLGAGGTKDLLCLSFSSTDLVGHVWGPDSQEVFDTALRDDLVVKELLNYLDARVGKGRYLLVLSADHGVCPMPEVSRAKGREAVRLDPDRLYKEAEAFLNEKFGAKGEAPARWLEKPPEPNNWYLNHAALRAAGVGQTRAEEVLSDWLRKQPGIEAVYTRSQLRDGVLQDDAIGQRVKRSFHPERSGDVLIVTKPYYLMDTYQTGTTHGTPHEYDTHVPLMVFGPGVRLGERREAVTPQAAAAILAHGLGVPPPRDAEAGVPEKLFGE
jgi:predicted AlkP superfamily pyrophosphatase or phosphodiesterase